MELGKVVKRVIIAKPGNKAKFLFGRIGIVNILDGKTVEICIDGNAYKLNVDAVQILPRSWKN